MGSKNQFHLSEGVVSALSPTLVKVSEGNLVLWSLEDGKAILGYFPSTHVRSILIETRTQGYRDGLAVKSSSCSSRGPEFGSHHPRKVVYSHL